jgi:hypothetical protein
LVGEEPLTITMVENRREGWQSPRSVNDLLVFRTANTAGGVNQSGDSRAGRLAEMERD